MKENVGSCLFNYSYSHDLILGNLMRSYNLSLKLMGRTVSLLHFQPHVKQSARAVEQNVWVPNSNSFISYMNDPRTVSLSF